MKQVLDAIERALWDDPILQALLGRDPQGDIKIYRVTAKENTVEPYLTWIVVPTGEEAQGTFGDQQAIEPVHLQLTAWGRTSSENWQIMDAADDVMLHLASVELAPYYVMVVKRLGTPGELPDRDTGQPYLPIRYRVTVGR